MRRDTFESLTLRQVRAQAALIFAIALINVPVQSRAQNSPPRCDQVPALRVIARPNPAARADDRRIPPPPPSRLVSVQPESLLAPPPQKLEDTPSERQPAQAIPDPVDLPPLPSVNRDAERIPADAEYQTDRRVERLRQQLDLLRHHLSERRMNTVPTEPPGSVDEHTTAPPVTNDHSADAAQEAHPHGIPVAPAPQHELKHDGQEPHRPQATTEPPPAPSKAASLIKGLPSSPYDRVSIADNLFAAGETVTAAQIYREIPLAELTRPEAGWVRFQIANCHRRLGQIDDARKIYRRLVVDPALGWLQELSKWWLDALDQRDALAKDQQRVHELVRQAEQVKHATNTP
jgi:hypothetical protein